MLLYGAGTGAELEMTERRESGTGAAEATPPDALSIASRIRTRSDLDKAIRKSCTDVTMEEDKSKVDKLDDYFSGEDMEEEEKALFEGKGDSGSVFDTSSESVDGDANSKIGTATSTDKKKEHWKAYAKH